MNFDELRDYQRECIDKLRDGIREGHRCQLLVAPTGAGKTVIASYLLGEAFNKGTRAFFICDRVSLVDQTSMTLDKYGIKHGVIQANHWRHRPWELIQVVSAQTLARREIDPPSLIVWDECFTKDAMVHTVSGLKPIHLVSNGEFVYNAIGIGRVVSTMARPVNSKKIVKVKFEDGTEIKCTEEHPFFTNNAWVKAGKLAGKSVVSIEGMRDLWSGFYSQNVHDKKTVRVFSRSKKLGKARDLRKVLCKEIEESNALAMLSGKNVKDIEENWSQAKVSWWKRNWSFIAATTTVESSWERLDSRVRGFLRQRSKGKGSANALQNRPSMSKTKLRNRSGWSESRIFGEKKTGHKKDRIFGWIRVVSVQVEQQPSDEVVYNLHVSGHPSYFVDGKLVHNCHTMYKSVIDYCENTPARVVGLTATPFTKGMGQIFTNVVNSTTTNKLIDQNWLVPLKCYAAKEIDMTGAEIKFDGEWKEKEIETRGIKIVGDVVEEWINKSLQYFDGPAKTIAFSATVAHGAELCRMFQERGYNFQQISYKDGSSERRRELIEEFRKPDSQIIGLVSCEALAKGFDVTDIKIGIGARPYRKSLSGHIQQIGRAMRSHDEKGFALWLDHSGNLLRFLNDTQEVFEHGVSDLKTSNYDAKVRKEKTEREKKEMKCHACGFVHLQRVCPACGAERVGPRSKVESKSGHLSEIDLSKKRTKEKSWMDDKRLVWRELCWIANDIKKGHHFSAEKFALAQYRAIYGVWPTTKYSPETAEYPRAEVRKKVQNNLIAYARGIR
jgi:DNA repair protein RadD